MFVSKKFAKVAFFLWLEVLLLSACSHFSESYSDLSQNDLLVEASQSGSVSFTITQGLVDKITAAAVQNQRTVTYSGADDNALFMDIALKSDGEYNETATVRVADGSKVEFKNVPADLEIFVKATAYKLEPKGKLSQLRTDLLAGESSKVKVSAGVDNKVSLVLKAVEEEGEEGESDDPNENVKPDLPEASTANYTVREWKQTITDDGYKMTKESLLSGNVGSMTSAAAAEYEGFEVQGEIEQQEIAKDGSTIVNIYYDRKTYTVTYNLKGQTSEHIPQSLSLRHGAKVKTTFDTSDVANYVLAGWFTDEACSQLYDSTLDLTADLTLYAKWIEASIAGYSINFNLDLTDINVSQSEMDADGKITFTAPVAAEGETYSYVWRLDGVIEGTSSSCVLDTSAFVEDESYDLILYITKGSELYSFFVQIIK